MTTLAQIDKIAAQWFQDKMRRRGFAVEKKFVYWRKRGALYDMFLPELLSGASHLRIRMSIWTPWIEDPNGDLGEFPPSYGLIGGTLSEDFPARPSSGELFLVATEKDIESSLQRILELIDRHALPWFPTVNSSETYLSYVGSRGFNPTREFKEKIKVGVVRGFELERFL
jgi:hypothetical protein